MMASPEARARLQIAANPIVQQLQLMNVNIATLESGLAAAHSRLNTQAVDLSLVNLEMIRVKNDLAATKQELSTTKGELRDAKEELGWIGRTLDEARIGSCKLVRDVVDLEKDVEDFHEKLEEQVTEKVEQFMLRIDDLIEAMEGRLQVLVLSNMLAQSQEEPDGPEGYITECLTRRAVWYGRLLDLLYEDPDAF